MPLATREVAIESAGQTPNGSSAFTLQMRMRLRGENDVKGHMGSWKVELETEPKTQGSLSLSNE